MDTRTSGRRRPTHWPVEERFGPPAPSAVTRQHHAATSEDESATRKRWFRAADCSAESVRRSVAADTPGGLVLALAAERLDDVSDVRESEGAFGVDGLVHLAEAGSVGGRSVGGAGGAERGESGDESGGENALHWTSPSVGGCVFTRHYLLPFSAQVWMQFVAQSFAAPMIGSGC